MAIKTFPYVMIGSNCESISSGELTSSVISLVKLLESDCIIPSNKS